MKVNMIPHGSLEIWGMEMITILLPQCVEDINSLGGSGADLSKIPSRNAWIAIRVTLIREVAFKEISQGV